MTQFPMQSSLGVSDGPSALAGNSKGLPNLGAMQLESPTAEAVKGVLAELASKMKADITSSESTPLAESNAETLAANIGHEADFTSVEQAVPAGVSKGLPDLGAIQLASSVESTTADDSESSASPQSTGPRAADVQTIDGQSSDLPSADEQAPAGLSADDIAQLDNGLLGNLGNQDLQGKGGL
ncbi:hypothetical protein [Burkholderia pseudomallei]|uniref:hypothetical protein n=1 Tax=Burkholderia pseudomallei TaxID=28450 RepID=UPI0012AEBFB6|nr:hypothetical protein [Burkholderia pseudomallei]